MSSPWDCLSSLCSCMLNLVTRQDLSCVFRTKEKVDDLESAMKDLTAKWQDLGEVIDGAQRTGKQPSDQHQLEQWRKNVEEKVDKVERLLDEYHRGYCVAGSCSINCFSRYKIGRNAIRLKEQITQLKAEQPELKFADIPPPKPVPESHNIVGKTIISNFDIARSYLADERVGMIGIWGMGGVGKTTLLKKINQSLLDDATMGFDHVLFIEASQNIQSEKLQEQIVKELQLVSPAGKKENFHALKTKNFVLLLDNIWDEVGLLELGIPHPCGDDNPNNQYKRKVIFTTRSEDVCARMGASKRMRVECLEDDEAWDLFKDNVKLPVIESDEKFREIAWQLMKKCAGLPLALKVIGKAMSNKKNVQYWESLLQNSNIPKVQGVENSLLPILKFSYDVLDTNIQECFLFASILRGSYKKVLSEYWMGLGLIGDFNNLQEAYGKAEHIFNTLEESCLLYFHEYSFDNKVEIHDVIYEMAMWIASDCGRNKNKWIVKQNDFMTTEILSIDVENCISANKVILSGRVEFLPILSHQCSDLKCLMMNDAAIKRIPEGFFGQMPNLTYLNISSIGIEELPKDIKCLVNLQYLNIAGNRISTLPKELLSLTKLEYLICRNTRCTVKDGLLSRLEKLKVIDLYPDGWVEPEELNSLKKHNSIKAIGMRVVSQEVLQQLSCLPTTMLSIQSLDDLDFLSFDSLSCKNHGFLEQLKILSCPQLERLEMKGNKTTPLRSLVIHDLKKLQDIIWADHISPPEFFHKLTSLYIIKCNLDNFAWVLHLPSLYILDISDCAAVETLFYVQEREIQQNLSSEQPMFPALKLLELKKLPKLVSISNVALDFPQLFDLTVVECAEIETLFCLATFKFPALSSLSLEMLPKLVSISNVALDFPRLFDLFVVECAEIETLFCPATFKFPALSYLLLKRLPKLVSISNVALDFPRLISFTVHQCVNIKKLPFKKRGINGNAGPIFINCEKEWWESLEWDDDTTTPSDFSPYLIHTPDACTTSGSE